MQEDCYQTYNAKEKHCTSRKITANLEGKRYAGEHKEGHCPYHKNVADLRLPIDQRRWAIKITIVQDRNEYRSDNDPRHYIASHIGILFLVGSYTKYPLGQQLLL